MTGTASDVPATPDRSDSAFRPRPDGGPATLERYRAEGCPHGARVRDALTDLGVCYGPRTPRLQGKQGGDVLNAQTCREMTELGGRDRIPFLVDTARDETRHESDVVEYVREHHA